MKRGLKVFLLVSVLVGVYSMAGFCWPVPDTGQTKCYDEVGNEITCPPPGDPMAQDGSYTHRISYTKLGYGGKELPDSATEWLMVRDNVTGLIWEVKHAKDGTADYANSNDADNLYSWYDSNPATNGGIAGTSGDGTDTEDFINGLNAANYGGYSDWRLPIITELNSLVKRDRYDPAINLNYFPNTAYYYFYWSLSSYAGDPAMAWYVGFDDGYADYEESGKSGTYHVRAVRGGQPPNSSFTDNGDGTVTDNATGLMWQKATAPNALTWKDTLAYCEALTLGGHTDWRLPDSNELQSIVDYRHNEPCINTVVFPDTQSDIYWSSTSNVSYPNYTWAVSFQVGDVYGDDIKSLTLYVRAVRGGQNRSFGNLIITSPQQASGWSIGSRMPIIWNTQNIPGNVKISLSRAGGRSDSFEIITDSTPNDGQFDWTVNGPITVNCVLKIEPISDPSKGNIQSLFRIGDILVDPAGLTVTEPDGSATFNIRLGKEPSSDVNVDLTNTNPGECLFTPESITLNSANWSTGVDVTVTAEPDGIIDGDQITSILTSLSSSADPLYDGLNIANVIITVENIDTGLVIDSVYPTYGEVGTNPEVKIKGVNFDSNTVLYLYPDGGTPSNITPVTLESPTLLSAILTDPGTAGSYTLEVSDGTNSAAMPGAVSFADTAAIQAQKRKKAIIVAGGGPFPDNDLWLTTENLTKLAYTALTTQGYTDETILYLTLNNTIDITGDGQNDVDGPATAAELETAIKTWAATDADELILYMIGPGRSSGFQFGSDNDPTFLSPATLDEWLDELQTAMNGPVIIVYDACQSESFLGPLAGTDRTLITSTSSDERAWFLDDGEISFSGIFWNGIFSLGEIYDAFREAEAMMRPLQTPRIDIDGDGVPDTLPPQLGNARQTPDGIIVGRGRSVSDAPPEITGADVDPEVLAGGVTTAEMSAGPITDTNGKGISNVWARIISPLDRYAPADRPVLAVPSQKLQDDDEDGIYERSYDDFIYSGDYPIYIHAVDRSDLQSRPRTVAVKQTAGLTIEKGDLDIDGDIDLTDVLIALKVAAGGKPPRAYTAFEVNGDEKIGMIEAIYGLMKVAELR